MWTSIECREETVDQLSSWIEDNKTINWKMTIRNSPKHIHEITTKIFIMKTVCM